MDNMDSKKWEDWFIHVTKMIESHEGKFSRLQVGCGKNSRVVQDAIHQLELKMVEALADCKSELREDIGEIDRRVLKQETRTGTIAAVIALAISLLSTAAAWFTLLARLPK